MNRPLVAVLVLAALGVGYLLGSTTSRGTGGGDAEAEALRDEAERMRLAFGERGPRLDPGVGLVGRGGRPGTGAAGDRIDVTRFEYAEDAFRALLEFAAARLAEGPEGHLALLDALNQNFFHNPGKAMVRQMLGTDAQAARFHYPLLRFALNHDVEVAAMTETVFRTLAEDPQRFAETEQNLLEMFVETIGYMLPGMVGPKRLEQLRGHGRAILETPPERQPGSVRRVRRDVQRALESWAPPLSPEAALARLRSGKAPQEEVAALLSRLTPELVGTLDLPALLGPLLEHDGYRVLGLLTRLRPDAETLEKLDRRMIDGVLAGRGDPGFLPYYLRFTGRGTWAQGRGFVEAGLQQSDSKAAGTFALAALGLGAGPDKAWIRRALDTYTFPRAVRRALEQRLE